VSSRGRARHECEAPRAERRLRVIVDQEERCAMRGSAWIKEQHVRVKDEAITEYQVNMMVTFIIDD
jgi:hypothetical protein